ncbi:hypothetical protein Ccar_14495 [Clostridium carboxidivorans P7]|uniref:Uncharacterized protein n=1 Tax=Clostridium carboxidivorans P7 TaxID=536227 RepID=C6PYQ9_9CLOT|nr:hypothetical protein [Clostridium carboxidivorans]AKN32006.1 hypothetical protein Ccar_14495 [Clostridium carboxidivorans P7]EET85640.1 conserved hypothetical protein [Clostridium carboxidivorans P7]EFG87856.1 hypothetical protein CLCAR_2457 [Clostridium carboxidivorans P7]
MVNKIKIILTIMQMIVLIPGIVLEYLSDKKMGVIRYLVFKKQVYEQGIFNSSLMNMYKSILIAAFFIVIIMIIYKSIKIKSNKFIKSGLSTIIINLLCMIFIASKKAVALEAYHFFVIAIFIIVILEYLKFILDFFRVNK